MTDNRKSSAHDQIVLERKAAPAGSVIMRQGDGGNCAFLIQSGQVRVLSENSGLIVELAKLGPGQIFGEMALVLDEKRSATVEAVEDTNLIIVTRKTFDEKLKKSDPTIRAIVPMLMKRIVQGNNAVMNKQGRAADLLETADSIYRNLTAAQPTAQHRKTLEVSVLPKLEEFKKTVEAFISRYGEEEKK